MSTIIEKLHRLTLTKSDIKNAISSHGINVTDDITFAEYAELIRLITSNSNQNKGQSINIGFKLNSVSVEVKEPYKVVHTDCINIPNTMRLNLVTNKIEMRIKDPYKVVHTDCINIPNTMIINIKEDLQID